MATDTGLAYADASALVKLVVEEPETAALKQYLDEAAMTVATSRIAIVEVVRAAALATPADEKAVRAEAQAVVEACMLVDPTPPLLREAASLTNQRLRSLDAIHLASARSIGAGVMIVYDTRLAEAALAAELAIVRPGA